MKRTALVAGVIFLALISSLRADETIASAQRALKDQGFYYGEITGRKDADTSAAIRRYQIRNGLKITGELDSETQRSLRVMGDVSARPKATAPQPPPEDTPDLREERAAPPRQYQPPRDTSPSTYAPAPYRYRQEANGLFDGTPYEMSSPDIQQRVVADAQMVLTRRGYYRSEIDGIYGPGTEFALRAFQSSRRLPPSGRFDIRTLGALGLMPGRNVPRPVRPVPPRAFPRPVYRGEWIPG
jgi:peptidoglycan hydrolase-like protein with peptidoglycan-binding domain